MPAQGLPLRVRVLPSRMWHRCWTNDWYVVLHPKKILRWEPRSGTKMDPIHPNFYWPALAPTMASTGQGNCGIPWGMVWVTSPEKNTGAADRRNERPRIGGKWCILIKDSEWVGGAGTTINHNDCLSWNLIQFGFGWRGLRWGLMESKHISTCLSGAWVGLYKIPL